MVRRKDHKPTWGDADDGRVRVLLECSPHLSPSIISKVIEDDGYDVRTCEGPSKGHECSLLAQGECELVTGADVVVNMLRGPESDDHRVLDAVSGQRRPAPVVVEMTGPRIKQLEAHETELAHPDQVTIIKSPISRHDLIEGIEAALAKQADSVPRWGDGVG